MSTAATLTLPTQDGGSVEVDISATAVYTAPPPPPPPPPAPSLVIPSTAIWSPALEMKGLKSQGGIWQCVHDEGTSGTSTGAGPNPTSPVPCGAVFGLNSTNWGGERWWAPVDVDVTANHFVYDTWVWIDRPDLLNCLELDINHVDGNGNTIILGIQWCPSKGCWQFTTMPNNQAHWNNSNIKAAVSDFAAKTWHHVQLASHHDANGVATYDTVTIDGVTQAFQNASGASWAPLNWSPKGLININMQLDGLGVGPDVINVVHSNLHIGRWQA